MSLRRGGKFAKSAVSFGGIFEDTLYNCQLKISDLKRKKSAIDCELAGALLEEKRIILDHIEKSSGCIDDLLTDDLLATSRVDGLSNSDFQWGDDEIKQTNEWARLDGTKKKPVVSYKAGIFDAISALNDRTGSSSVAIKKHMQANLPEDKKWMNTVYLKALNKAVANGELTKNKRSFKLSTATSKSAATKNAAPKKKAYLEKKAVPNKSTVSYVSCEIVCTDTRLL